MVDLLPEVLWFKVLKECLSVDLCVVYGVHMIEC